MEISSTPPDPERFPPDLLANLGFVRLLESDGIQGRARVEYTASSTWAHSGGTTIQGGLITAWLDNCMAFALAARAPDVAVASVEMKVSFLDRTAPGAVLAAAWIRREGGAVAFLEAELTSEGGRVLATASSTVRLLRKK